ncbi:MAG: hypothetical protein ACK45H_01445 [Bacteroidota bacterium]|jgi:hypothetical protein
MSKKRAIISYDKLTIDQKKQILKDFPDGYINHLTTIKTPTGEMLDALIWETDEAIYLVKINKIAPKAAVVDEDEDEFEDDFDKVDGIKEDDLDSDEEEEEDEYDRPDEDDSSEEDDDE